MGRPGVRDSREIATAHKTSQTNHWIRYEIPPKRLKPSHEPVAASNQWVHGIRAVPGQRQGGPNPCLLPPTPHLP
ncbi:hypothetical protein AMTR_s00072p00015880 [Amborella trichopoda]|uniref:Uncharacterized protein n=1 Tax=Amborella trichopoda TaxID=13333 RepID=W1NTD4_AMBTC|nr:hypothetical protein AMTR_s00072p00015880 [Amborella trichopoda]